MAGVLTLTINPALDKSSAVERLIPNEKLRCEEPRFDPGGGGINVSRVLAELGCPSLAIYTSGGATGDLFNQLLEKDSKIEKLTIPIKNWTRENLLIIESSTGNQYRFGMPGPELQEGEWKEVLAIIQKHSSDIQYLVASGSLPKGVPSDFYRELSLIAAKHQIRFVLDTSGEALREGIKGKVFLLKPNLRELRQLTGESLDHEAEQEAAAERLVQEGRSEIVILSLSSAGAVLVTKNQKHRLRAPTVKMISKVGAGDSMIGGIVCGLMRNMDLVDAVRYGIACGAATVASPGTDLCKKEDVEKLFHRLVHA